MVPALLLGVVFTALFQGMMLAMATRLQALSIGFVAQCKVLPDYACSLLASGRALAVCACHLAAVGAARQPLQCPAYKHESLSSVYFQLHLLGAALVLGGALSYARLRLRADARCAYTSGRPLRSCMPLTRALGACAGKAKRRGRGPSRCPTSVALSDATRAQACAKRYVFA